ncbi:AAA family ATPase [Pseudoalteromonas sp. SR41-7]|uniref:AAA family ATPase n=1 Tax=Pseudoalteromonas sp. SR41-7 TaxID=2760947 RepID=UPI0015FF01E2|nr:AAA family ATPase [Pseudoalteromonas sp. SR41-7]MBB1296933.1 AAA family ATPase [Pseudoalteromonas sp. SR41-7]
MKLQEIVIHNFMPYKGEQKIEFPQHETQNVMLLFGDNMRGKTSFLNSIRWGFYGLALGRHMRLIPRVNLVNSIAASEDNWTMSIVLKFSHEGRQYELRRQINKKEHISIPRNDGDFEELIGLKIDNQVINGDSIVNEINQVTPEEISRFFLFDGELLQEYENLLVEQSEQGEKIKEHIEQALGVPALVNGRNEFSKLLTDARRIQTRDAKNSSDAKTYAEQQRVNEGKQATLEKDIQDLEIQQRDVQKQIDDIEEELKNTEAVQRKKYELDTLKGQLKKVEEQLAYDADEQRKLFKDAWKDVLFKGVEPLVSSLQKRRNSLMSAANNKAVLDSKISELQKSLAKPICPTCTQIIPQEELDVITAKIEELKAEAELSSVDFDDVTNINLQIDKLNKVKSHNECSRICELVTKRRKAQVAVITIETQIDDIQEEIRGFDTEQIMRQREKKDRLGNQLFKLENDIKETKAKLNKLSENQAHISTLISKSSGSEGQSSTIRVNLYQNLESVFKAGINELRDALRGQVEEFASNAFSQLTTEKTYAGLEINNNYGLSILDHTGNVLKERSAGAEQIVALSLIDGLNKTARKSGPIVMDTPLGRLDPNHRSNVLKYLPKMAEQVVLLVHEGEIDPSRDLSNFAERIGARYQIQRISATESRIVRSN